MQDFETTLDVPATLLLGGDVINSFGVNAPRGFVKILRLEPKTRI